MNRKALRFSAQSTVKKYDYFFIFLISFLYCHWYLLWSGTGFGVFLFTILFYTLISLRLDAAGMVTKERRLNARPWLLTMFLSAFACVWFDYSTLGWFNFLFLSIAAVHWATVLADRRILPFVSNYLPLDLFLGVIAVPFANFGRFIGTIFQTKVRREAIADGTDIDAKGSAFSANRRQIFHNLLLIVVTVLALGPLLLIVLNLLSYADEGFMRMIADLIDGFFGIFDDLITIDILELMIELLLAIPVSCYLFGLLWGLSRPDRAKGWKTREQSDHLVSSLQFVPRIMIYTGLVLFSGIYILFLSLQIVHIAEALTHSLPDSITYSAFARQGFFELCAVAFINLILMTGSWLLCSRKQTDDSSASLRPLQLLLALLSLLTIFLVITALAKMALYIQAYGLTRLRIYTSWFMLWLLLVFAILTLATARKRAIAADHRFSPAKLLTTVTIVMFLTLNYMNPDRIIVNENLSRYETGAMTWEELDHYGLGNLSDDAALALLDHYDDYPEIRHWASLIEPEYRFRDEPEHWSISSLRLKYRLEQLNSR